MKLNRYFSLLVAGLAFVACSDMDEIAPKANYMLDSQVKETNVIAPSRGEAAFNGMLVAIGQPIKIYTNGRADDWEFLMLNYANDVEGADLIIPDSNYNWFSVCGEYTSRNANYANPYIRYAAPYNMIGTVNTYLTSFSADTQDEHFLNLMAQAKCLRAWSYSFLVEAFQFNYQIAKDKPAVPIVTEETTDFTNNPRATVAEVYDLMLKDLNEAIEVLDKSTETRKTKMYIDKNVAHGLRARVYLNMGEWQKAYDDAVAAADGYTPATIKEVSKPTFMDIKETNWLWGYDMTTAVAAKYPYATTTAWLRSFSGDGYSPACACYAMINSDLWEKIPATDIRKQWWVDENLKSTLLDGLEWDGNGDVAHLTIADIKEPFLPYTNVKFGVYQLGTTNNDEDMPLMRVEEMILIQAEAQAHLDQAKAKEILSSFVQTYRDPSYKVDGRNFTLLDEIWFQRRIELWGEGFGIRDIKRLNKPLVRFKDRNNNQPDAFRFNMAANDGWLLMRFPQDEMNTNFGIVDNTDGELPVMEQNPELRDGVTD